MKDKKIIWINNKVISENNAKLSIFDRSFLYGDGLFESMRSYRGKVFCIDQHIDRLFTNSKILRIKAPYSKVFLKNIISKLVKTLNKNNVYVRIAITRGKGKPGLDPSFCKKPNVILLLNSFAGYPGSYYKKGAKTIISSTRTNNYSPLSSMKTNNYLNNILAFMEAREKGKDDAIMRNTSGFISEATTSNIFMVKGKSLITPQAKEGLLPGITRGVVITLAPAIGFKVLEKRITVSELKKSEEIFLTNSIAEIRGVTEVDGVKISGGKVGPVTRLILRLYSSFIKKESER